ncbi:U2 small nuclear ribonucleoprotein auxiliary factor 35 kDa subunit-related protein 2 isoform X2 [Salminus brasiliensis]|uniref:U2 small nuclear ribonucleoprotein auxiliary factor 35 kDa subunit-related protein 2 isoform X2 n=1 Tax=Salminus brasiliensis TaxID=930266 RepID=UPI003B8377C8
MLSTECCQGLAGTLSLTAETQSVEPVFETLEQQSGAALLSGKQRRALLKRDRRKRKRQALAKLRSSIDQPEVAQKDQHDDDDDDDDKVDDGDDKEADQDRERLHQEWVERERIAQEEFRLIKEKEDAAQRRREEEERIREEWEEQQKKEREEQEQKQQKKRDREEAVQKMLDQAESQLENGGAWKNPDAPVDFGTEKDRANCPFFLKTGACRFGDRCSRKHDHPVSSSTLMVRSMFVTFGMEQSKRDDYDTDASLEYSEEEIYQQFLDFYEDVLPEFRNAGKVVQFKVSCNFEPHLRGNVYVQYDTEDQCKEAFMMFNGRWYAGKQLQCEFSPVTKWKTAICGLFDRQKCPKGKHCNFLHVFRNPTNEFWEADRDLHLSPDRGGGLASWHSERRDRTLSQRSYSPGRFHRRWSERNSRSREGSSQRRRRNNSRERRSRSRSRESQRSSLRRGQASFSERNRRSRSRERRRSRSRGRDGHQRSLTDSRKRSFRRSESGSPEESSRNGSVKRNSKSPKGCDASTDAVTSSYHHKCSKKKKKKKSKKKQKKKKSKSHSGSSSAESGKESEDEDEGALKQQNAQNTEKSGDNSEITEPLAAQQDNTENHSRTLCQVEDENLQKIDVTNTSVATETNTSLNV